MSSDSFPEPLFLPRQELGQLGARPRVQDFFGTNTYYSNADDDDTETIVDGWSGFSGDINVHPDQENVLLFPQREQQDIPPLRNLDQIENDEFPEPIFLQRAQPFFGGEFEVNPEDPDYFDINTGEEEDNEQFVYRQGEVIYDSDAETVVEGYEYE